METSVLYLENYLEVDGIAYFRELCNPHPMFSLKKDFRDNTEGGWDVATKYWGNPDKAMMHDLRYSLEYHNGK